MSLVTGDNIITSEKASEKSGTGMTSAVGIQLPAEHANTNKDTGGGWQDQLRTLRQYGAFSVALTLLETEIARGSAEAHGWLAYMYQSEELLVDPEKSQSKTQQAEALRHAQLGEKANDSLSKAVYAKIFYDRNKFKLNTLIVKYLTCGHDKVPHYFYSIFMHSIYLKILEEFTECFKTKFHGKPNAIVIPHELYEQLVYLDNIESATPPEKSGDKSKKNPANKAKVFVLLDKAHAKEWLIDLKLLARRHLVSAVGQNSAYAYALLAEFDVFHRNESPAKYAEALEGMREPYANAVLGRMLFHNVRILVAYEPDHQDIPKLYAKAWDCYDKAVAYGRAEFPFQSTITLKLFLQQSSQIIETEPLILKQFLFSIIPQCLGTEKKPARTLSELTRNLITHNQKVQKSALDYFLDSYGNHPAMLSKALKVGTPLNQLFTPASLNTILQAHTKCIHALQESKLQEQQATSKSRHWYDSFAGFDQAHHAIQPVPQKQPNAKVDIGSAVEESGKIPSISRGQ